MFKRVLLGLIFLASIAWVGYIGYGIFTATNEYSEIHVFNEADGQVIIVNRSSEVAFDAINGFAESPTYDIAQSLTPAYKTGYFSLKRPQFILVNSQNWDAKQLQGVFGEENLQVDEKKKTISINDWSGTYKNDRLYLSQKDFEKNNPALSPFIYDKKASASVLTFDPKNNVSTVLDIYFKEDGKVDYITRNEDIEQGKQIRDQVLFASYVSRKVNSYHFFERDYYATLDTVFANGPMSKWLQSGFVKVDYNGTPVLICDYIGGQDPVLILNDLQQTTDSSRFTTPLTSTFPSSGKSYYVKYLDDLVVISEKEDACDLFVADYKLGNTIAQSNASKQRIFGGLPQSVSERYIADDLRISRAVYNGYLLETKFGQAAAEMEAQDESIAMMCDFNIVDFQTFDQPGKLVALGSKGEVIFFNKGKKEWAKQLESKALGSIQLIELHGGGDTYVLVNTEDAIHLWNTKGQAASGFPIKLEKPAINEVKFYRWKDKSYFLVTDEENTTLQFDSEGRELTHFASKVRPERQIDVWASQGRLFFGFASSTQFEMFEVAKNKTLRTFDIPENSQSLKTPNQLFHYGVSNGKLYQVNQKGTKTNFESYAEGQLLPINRLSKNPVLIVRSRNTLHFVNQKGIEISKLRMPFNEIEEVAHFNLNSGKTVISVIDGLENNVYLYNTAGSQLYNRSFEGKTKVNVSATGNGLMITTVVDNYVIQYFEN